jgi:queuine tRNA-ribosyltransferase
MNWPGNILTDSGGFQIFSLARLRKITGEGVRFRSHIDGSWHFFDPETVVDIQTLLGSDIQMQLDVCSGWGASRKETEKALTASLDWLARAQRAWGKKRLEGYGGSLFAIVQGGFFKDLRERSVSAALEAETPGIAIGGLSVGEPEEVFAEFLAHTASLLPRDKPRYVMGIGTPRYILEAIEQGIDMFDCVFPTRTGRNGLVFSRDGSFTLKKAENRLDFRPIDEECGCKVCREYSRAYLRHLFKSKEILCSMLASYHNLYFLHDLVRNAGKAIDGDRFVSFKKEFLARFEGREK